MNKLRITARKSINKSSRRWCIEELIEEHNPWGIWHILVPWSKDEESIQLKFADLMQEGDSRSDPPASGTADEGEQA